jgi:hypothetical protein
MQFPQELVEQILLYLSLEKLISLNNRLALIKYYILEKRYENLYKESIKNGDLEVVKWFHSNELTNIGIKWALSLAASNGKFEVVKFLHSQHDIACDFVILVRNPLTPITILSMIHTQPQDLYLMPDCCGNAISAAIKNGHRDIANWLEANRQISCVDKKYDSEIVKKVLMRRQDIEKNTKEIKYRIL